MGVPTTNHAFEDVILLQKALQKNLPRNAYNTEYFSLKSIYKDFTIEKAKELLEKFSQFDKHKNGKISASDFCRAMGLPFNELTIEIFQLFDSGNDGEIDFREFVSGMVYLSSKNNAEVSKTIKFIFTVMDTDNDGFIGKDDFKTLFKRVEGVKASELEEIFDKIDQKKEGKISSAQFIDYLKKNTEHMLIFKALGVAIVQGSSLKEIKLKNLEQSSFLSFSGFLLEDHKRNQETSGFEGNRSKENLRELRQRPTNPERN